MTTSRSVTDRALRTHAEYVTTILQTMNNDGFDADAPTGVVMKLARLISRNPGMREKVVTPEPVWDLIRSYWRAKKREKAEAKRLAMATNSSVVAETDMHPAALPVIAFQPRSITDLESRIKEQITGGQPLEPSEFDTTEELHEFPPDKAFYQEGDVSLQMLASLAKTLLELREPINDLYNDNLDKASVTGVAVINGNRFLIHIPEKIIYLSDEVDSFAAIKLIFKKMENDNPGWSSTFIWETVLTYCIIQAQRDLLVREAEHDYTYSAFGIIATFGKEAKQTRHIDLAYPNYQCTILLTQGEGNTVTYKSISKATIKTPEAFGLTLWKDVKKSDTKSVNELISAMSDSEVCRDLIKEFGNVLVPDLEAVKQIRRQKGMKKPAAVGTTCVLPGSIVHAGPASKKFRAIIFCSATRTDKASNKPYNSDVQMNPAALLASLWHDILLKITNEDTRRFALGQLLKAAITKADPFAPDLVRNCAMRSLIAVAQYGDRQEKEKAVNDCLQLIDKQAKLRSDGYAPLLWDATY